MSYSRDSRTVLSLSLWSGLLLVDAIVLSRRLSGAMTIPLPAPLVWGSSLVVTAAAMLALVSWRTASPPHPPTPALPHIVVLWLPDLLALALPLAWGVAIAVGATPFAWGGLAALWGMNLVGVGLARAWCPGRGNAPAGGEPASDVDAGWPLRTSDRGQRAAGKPRPEQFQQRSLVDGVEVIEGEAQVAFEPGQKEAMLHLSFCPPFAALPEVEAEDALGGDLEIRAEAVHPFGARLSVRRASNLESAESRQVSYVAAPPAAGEAAA